MDNIINYDMVLQIWGGIGYLVAQIFLAVADSGNDNKKLRVFGWSSYLVGMPPWIILLISKNDWVVAGTDLGSIPSMILGIVTALKKNTNPPKFFDVFAKTITIIMIALGFIYSIYHFHGIKTFSQVLEIVVTISFLSGTYLLAKKKPEGWLLLSLSCISMVILMLIQVKIFLLVQQAVSFIFAIIAYIKALKNINNAARHTPA